MANHKGNYHEVAVEPTEHTIRVADLKRIALQDGEALLVRFPRDMEPAKINRARYVISDWLKTENLTHWPVVYSLDDIEFLVISEPERKGIFAGENL